MTHTWDAMQQRMALPRTDPARAHVGWQWYVDGVRQEATDLRAAADQARAGRGFVWCGLKDPDDATMGTFQELFDLHELAAEDAVEGHTRSKLEVFGDALFMVVSTVDYVAHKTLTETSEIVSTGQVMAYVGPWFVLTSRKGGRPFMNRIRGELEREPEELADGPWRVLYAILDHVVDDFTETVAEIEQDVEGVEEAVFSPGVRPDVDGVYHLKRELIEFKRCLSPLVVPLQRLQQAEPALPNVPPDAHAYFREVSDHLVGARESTAALDEVLTAIIQSALTRVSLADNQDMRRISAAVAMFAVPTTIGAIYGMNFDNMPELHSEYGYYIVLAVMALSIIAMAVWFRRRGWL